MLATAIAGVLYIAGAWWSPYWVSSIAPANRYSMELAQLHGLWFLAREATVYIPAVAVLSTALLFRRSSGLRRSLASPSWPAIALTLVVASFAGILLDAARLWPWVWRYNLEASLRLVMTLLSTRQFLAIVLWLLVWGLLVPAIEEVVFRGALLQWVYQRRRSETLAVAVSSAAFGLLHVGPVFNPSGAAVRNAVFAALFGVVAGTAVLRRSGRLDVAIALHCGHSLTSLLYLLARACAL